MSKKKKSFVLLGASALLFTSVASCSPAPVAGELSVCFHYKRTDGNYTGWNLWLWEKVANNGAVYEFNGTDSWGVTAKYPLSTWPNVENTSMGFIVRTDAWVKDVSTDRFVDFKKLTVDATNTYHVYLVSGDPNIYEDTSMKVNPKIENASFYSKTHITVYTNGFEPSDVALYADSVDEVPVRVSTYPNRAEIYFEDGQEVDYTKQYSVSLKMGDEGKKEQFGAVVVKSSLMADTFLTDYLYDGELGAIYSKESTTFKVWSPFSSKIVLKIYDTGTPRRFGGSDTPIRTVEMTKGEKGVFSATEMGDLEGKYYTYVVTNSSYYAKEIVDPYAKSCGVNGLRGMIVDFSKTNPEGWDDVDYLQYDRKELTVYETHVADVTSSSTWTGTEENRKLFAGMHESGTTYKADEESEAVSTGFDHIKELGVNAVQIIPIFDQANEERSMTFNWGYNPLNYNCLEGGYSSDPTDGYKRIVEFKELVRDYYNAGIEIIMDVVYNHVNSAVGSNFDVLFPEYYYRYDRAGALSNGSGCGNETASNHFMMRKFIVDSAKFWMKEYKLGGFRFDLMGLHDIGTMKEIAEETKKINPYAVVYGEPWTGGTSTGDYDGATKENGAAFKGYGGFNDSMRDALIKSGMKGDQELGWITNKESKIAVDEQNAILNGIKGTFQGSGIYDPDKVVNYVTCHDNYTLYDRFLASEKFTKEDVDEMVKMSAVANAVVFTSQGTTFMLAGEEFLRSKNGVKDSYSSSYKINELDYSLKVQHKDLFETYKKLIALKQGLSGLHLSMDDAMLLSPSFSFDGATISYKIRGTFGDGLEEREYYIIHSNGLDSSAKFDLSGYQIYWSTVKGTNVELTSQTSLEKFESIIAYRVLDE